MINIEGFLRRRKLGQKKIKNKEYFFLKKFAISSQENTDFLQKKITLTLLLSNNRCIKKLNKNFRNKNKSTDILSFPFDKKILISKKNLHWRYYN